MWALPLSRTDLKSDAASSGGDEASQGTLILSRTGDRAPLASDPSTDPEAGMRRGSEAAPLPGIIPALKR